MSNAEAYAPALTGQRSVWMHVSCKKAKGFDRILAPAAAHDDVLGDLVLNGGVVPALPYHVTVDLVHDQDRVVLLSERHQTETE